jgi:hypothetical protein
MHGERQATVDALAGDTLAAHDELHGLFGAADGLHLRVHLGIECRQPGVIVLLRHPAIVDEPRLASGLERSHGGAEGPRVLYIFHPAAGLVDLRGGLVDDVVVLRRSKGR